MPLLKLLFIAIYLLSEPSSRLATTISLTLIPVSTLANASAKLCDNGCTEVKPITFTVPVSFSGCCSPSLLLISN